MISEYNIPINDFDKGLYKYFTAVAVIGLV